MTPEKIDQARRFLGALARFDLGLVVLANLAAAVRNRILQRNDCDAFLEICAGLHNGKPDETGQTASQALDRAIANSFQKLFFLRHLNGGADAPFAFVLRYEHFFPDAAALDLWDRQGRLIFKRPYIEEVEREGGRMDAESRPKQMMQDIQLGFEKHLNPAARLGRDEFVVFVTRVDEAWKEILDVGTSCADEVRDRLGLPYRKGNFLIELRSKVSLGGFLGDVMQAAAPTVLEAWRCEFFRQVPDCVDQTHWGRTVHLRRLSENNPPIDGAPEAIIQSLPIGRRHREFDMHPAGFIRTGPPATVRMHLERLCEGRSVENLIEGILAP